MTIKEEIEVVFKQYLRAIFTRDFESMYAILYEPDVQEFRDTITEFAQKMNVFGESDDFIQKLGFSSVSQLESLSLFEFMSSIFQLISREIGQDHLNKIIDETVITHIEETEYFSIVSYQYPIFLFETWELFEGEVEMIKSDNQWKIFFKSGLKAGLSRFQADIDRYYLRKELDSLENLGEESNLTKFSVIGYKDDESGKVVLEARFKDAGEFSNGLAYVQIMTKYGYINPQGELVIKPQFLEARDFSEERAAVRQVTEDGERKWGFIDTLGNSVISYQYDEVSQFSEGLCAVEKVGKWGYINLSGEVVIPFSFDAAENFSEGSTYVIMENEQGEEVEFLLDKEGNIEEVE
ncbi:MAG: WG repeat-containing protein [Bacteroidota bacterium]